MPQKNGLDSSEVALIKAMLAKGMRNNAVQFYFNRPDRPVNSGRITEIKKGDKWGEIERATDEELDAFLSSLTETDIPQQLPAAISFEVNEEGRISRVVDPPVALEGSDEIQIAMYLELREKVGGLLGVGHNLLGALLDPLNRFQSVLPPDIAESSITILGLRGNSLRSILKAHDEVKNQEDIHPEKLDPAYAERLRDVVEAFNIFILGDVKGMELDNRRLGPVERQAADEAISLARPIVDQASDIATTEVSDLLTEQLDRAEDAPDNIDGSQLVELMQETSSNFVITIIRNGFHSIKAAFGAEFKKAWEESKKGVYATLGGLAVLKYGTIVEFISTNVHALVSYTNSVIQNPSIVQIIEFISKSF